MKPLFLALVATIVFRATVSGAAEYRGEKTLAISFDGKGTAMLWDAGVVRALHERLKPGAIDRYVFVGSSSGAIASTYFACHGVDKATIDAIDHHAKTFPKEVLDEATGKKSIQLLLGVKPTIAMDPIVPFIKIATRDLTCVPKHPLLIATSNMEVLDTRTDKPFAGSYRNTFDRRNYVVSRDGRKLGKACTYFVNEEMLDIIKAIPADERLCDLRVMRKASDVELAIRASIAEPTYFEPVREVDVRALLSVFPIPEIRFYAGGFIMNSPVEVKRALPEAFFVGTGRAGYQPLQDGIIQNWFSNFTMNETLYNQRWWFDAQVVLSRETWDGLYEKAVTPPMQIRRGYEAASLCFDGKGPAAEKNEKPFYAKDAWGQDLDAKRGRGLSSILQ